jgi:hypothetical protein
MRARYRPLIARVAVMALLAGSVSCGDVVRQGKAPVIILIDELIAASGATPGDMGGFLNSDVQILRERTLPGQTLPITVSTVVNDVAQATMRLIPKDAGNGATNLNPTPWNSVTINRYRIVFIRADGRNTPGLDVPYPVDGAVTATVTSTPVVVPFEIVRIQQKFEQPLISLASKAGSVGGARLFISTIAEITFYGADAMGNDIQVKGTISVTFSDFADPL